MRKILKILIGAIFIFIICLLAIGNYFYIIAISNKTDKSKISNQDSEDIKYSPEEKIWFNSNAKEVENISIIGEKLTGYEFIKDIKAKWIVVVHGYGTSAKNMSYYIKNFYDKGYNVFAPDLIGHGKSGGDLISMGGYDSIDLKKWIDVLNDRYLNPDIALFGISMGASTVINSLGQDLPKNVKVFIEDSGYLELKDQFNYQLKKQYKLPSFPIIPTTSLITKLRAGFGFDFVDAKKSLENTKLPALIIHGDEDGFVPTYNSKKIYEIINSPKEIYLSKGSKHVQASRNDYENYWGAIYNFLDKYFN